MQQMVGDYKMNLINETSKIRTAKRWLLIAIAIIVGTFFTVLFISWYEQERIAANRESMILKAFYAEAMGFQNNQGIHFFLQGYFDRNPRSSLVLVSSREEIFGFSNDVMVAFPSYLTQIKLQRLNLFFTTLKGWDEWYSFTVETGLIGFSDFESWERDWTHAERIDLNDFSLSYPITLYDVVYNWENVNALITSHSFLLTAVNNARGIHEGLIRLEIEKLNAAIEALETDNFNFAFPISRQSPSMQQIDANAILVFYEAYLKGIVHIPLFLDELTWRMH